jgi:1,4-dihydroxy-2-naphthoate octaprenyltransferase
MSVPPQLSIFKIWILAARPKTLPAAAASAILGNALAIGAGKFNLLPALATICISILLQIGANFANDLFDFQRGADTTQRLGPLRVTQAGLLTPKQVSLGMILVFGVSSLLGLYLTRVAGWPVIIIGLSAILAALAYTGGPFPFGYHSLGDLFVFIFFGLAAVGGTYYVQTLSQSTASTMAGIGMGLLITNILVVNNVRDIETDIAANKITMAVRLGKKGSRLEYLVCLVVAYLIPLILIFITRSYLASLLTWLSIPLAIRLYKDLSRSSGRALNRTLAGTANLALLYAILFSIGSLIFR